MARAVVKEAEELLDVRHNVLDHGYVVLTDYMGCDDDIANAARVSNAGQAGKKSTNQGLIRYLLRHRHTSPFEMCLRGDTVIPTMPTPSKGHHSTQKSYTIRELAEAFAAKKPWVKLIRIRTVNPDGSIVGAKIKDVRWTGVRQVFKVTEDSLLHRSIVSTSNHPFFTSPKEYKQLKSLSVGDPILQNGTSAVVNDHDFTTLWNNGLSIREIEGTTGVSRSTIYSHLKKAGIDTKRRKGFIRKQVEDLADPHARTRRKVANDGMCQICGELSAYTDVAHIDSDLTNETKENLARLCRRCHKALDFKTIQLKTYTRKILSIEPKGEADVFDLEVDHPNHNFVANGFVVHNCEFKFICRMPIFVARQWIRHRTASVNEQSGRYSVLSNEFYIPTEEELCTQSKGNNQGRSDERLSHETARRVLQLLQEDAEHLFRRYHIYLGEHGTFGIQELEDKGGIAKELARINLPLSTYTEWVWKIDLHNLLHFLGLRRDSHAQWEMRQYAEVLYKMAKAVAPEAVKAFDDYQFHAVTFSQHERKLLAGIIGSDLISGSIEGLNHLVEDFGLSDKFTTREIDEFREKLRGLIELAPSTPMDD